MRRTVEIKLLSALRVVRLCSLRGNVLRATPKPFDLTRNLGGKNTASQERAQDYLKEGGHSNVHAQMVSGGFPSKKSPLHKDHQLFIGGFLFVCYNTFDLSLTDTVHSNSTNQLFWEIYIVPVRGLELRSPT